MASSPGRCCSPCSGAEVRPAAQKELWMHAFQGGPVSLGNLPSPSQSISHLQFWALQLLPYVGCLCLHDPSHINVIIRASIYTDFLLSRTWGSAGVVHFIFPALLVHGYCSILCLGTNWEREGMGQKHGGDRKVQTPTGKWASGS